MISCKDLLRKVKYSYLLWKFLSGKNIKVMERLMYSYREKIQKNTKNKTLLVFDTTQYDPIVSVVTPTFNSAFFLPKLAESLSRQSLCPHVQWVVVDDCSNDDTEQTVKELASRYSMLGIKYFRNRQNGGATYSLKQGFRLSDADFIAWVSADDYYVDSKKLEKDVEILRSHADFVFSKFNLYGESVEKSRKVETVFANSGVELFADITFANNINGSSFVVRREVYNDVGGFDDVLLNVDGDYDLFSRLILSGYKVALSDSVAFVTLRPEQTSAQRLLMQFGTSISKGRFLRIPKIKDFLVRKFIERSVKFYWLSYLSPIFVIEVVRELPKLTLLKLSADLRGSAFAKFLKEFSEFVDFTSESSSFKRFRNVISNQSC